MIFTANLLYTILVLKNATYLALVLRCKKVNESDLMITLLTQQQGKISVLAKGVRKLRSSKKSSLETGNLISTYLVFTKGLPLLTQAVLISDASQVRLNLTALKNYFLLLEILNNLLVNEELSPVLFRQILYLREMFLRNLSRAIIKKHFLEILHHLGYLDSNDCDGSVSHQVTQIIGRNLHSFEFLTIPV